MRAVYNSSEGFMWIRFVRSHKVSVAVALFLIVMAVIHTVKPAIIYNQEGGFRPFGLGYKHKTVVPMWSVAISLAIFSYLLVLWCITYL